MAYPVALSRASPSQGWQMNLGHQLFERVCMCIYVCEESGFGKRVLTRQCKMHLPHAGQLDHQCISRRLSPTDRRSSPSHMMSVEHLVWVNQEQSRWIPESVHRLERGRGRSTVFRSPEHGEGPLCETQERNCECTHPHRGEVIAPQCASPVRIVNAAG